MHFAKIIWGLRALLYRPFFGHVGLPSYIGRPCFIEGCKRIDIGKYVRIFPGVRMEAIKNGRIIIGDNTAIEQNVHITSYSNKRCRTDVSGILRIGKDVTILANTFVTNLDHEYTDITKSILEQGVIQKETIIDDGCFIGYGAAIQAGTKLGKHCIVGASAVVRGEYPDYCVLVGNPARVIKRYNSKTQRWEKEGV